MANLQLNKIAKAAKWSELANSINQNFELLKLALLAKYDGGKEVVSSYSALPDPTTASTTKLYIYPNQAHTQYTTVISNGNEWVTLLVSNGDINDIPKLIGGVESDLDIADENGYVILRLENGHIKTQKFNSSLAVKREDLDAAISEIENLIPDERTLAKIVNNDNVDFALSDENGNAILVLENGHIKTQKFDSENFNPSTEETTKDIEYPQFMRYGINGNGQRVASAIRFTSTLVRASKGDVVKIKDKTKIGGIRVFEYSSSSYWGLQANMADFSLNDYTVTGDNTKFIRITAKKDNTETELFTNKDFINNIYVEHKTPVLHSDNRHILGSLIPEGWYVSQHSNFLTDEYTERPQTALGRSDAEGSTFLTLEEINSYYSELATDYPNYVKKTLLGKDQSNTYDIYKYEFIPERMTIEAGASRMYSDADEPNAVLGGNVSMPKIYIQSGIHPVEYPCSRALLNFLMHLCNDWQSDKYLEYIRWNVHLVIIPMLNPWGYVNSTRYNSRHVDINRNYNGNGGWAADTDNTSPSADTYKGESQYSEIETKYSLRTILENADAIAIYDFHTHGVWDTMEHKTCISIGNKVFQGNLVHAAAADVVRGLTISGIKNHNVTPIAVGTTQRGYESGYMGFLQSGQASTGSFSVSGAEFGIPSASPEVMYRKDLEENWCFYSKDIDCLNEEFIANLILNTLRQKLILNN